MFNRLRYTFSRRRREALKSSKINTDYFGGDFTALAWWKASKL